MTLFLQLRHQASDFSCVSPKGWGAGWGCHYSFSLPPTTPSIQEGLGSKGQQGQRRDLDLRCLQGTAGSAPAAGAEEHGCSSARSRRLIQQERQSPLLHMPSAPPAEKAPLQFWCPLCNTNFAHSHGLSFSM